jgi:Abnormal spindle-like microcephaly-assoc'd, ASPM-SPD-2-Hydin
MIDLHAGVNPIQSARKLPSTFGVAKWATIAAAFLAAGAAEAKIVYVNAAAATTTGDGSSWASSYKYLQDALDHSSATDTIYLAKGTYYPDRGAKAKFGNREESFVLKGQALYGGFAGTETSPSQRNPQVNLTVLSGAIWDRPSEDVYWSLHVVVINENSTLDSLTVANGHANGSQTWSYPRVANYDEGGGCYVNAGKALTLNDCIFRDNLALQYGGAIALQDSAAKVVAKNCLFERNSIRLYSITFGLVAGGAIKGNVDATDCRFIANEAVSNNYFKGTISESRGGAIFGKVTAVNCLFSRNAAKAYANGDSSPKPIAAGGAVAGNLIATRCRFISNEASTPYFDEQLPDATVERTGSGGAFSEGSIVAANCIFSENKSSTGKINPDDGTGTGGGGAICVTSGKSNLMNCVFVKNASGVRGGAIHSGTTAFADSLVVNNCTFIDNEVANTFEGAALSCGGIVRILNNIFWCNNTPSPAYSNNNFVHVINNGVLRNSGENYPDPSTTALNIVKGGSSKIKRGIAPDVFLGNEAATIISGDPQFVNLADPDGPDNIWGTADDGLRLNASSAAIGINRDPRIITSANFLPLDTLDLDQDGNVTENTPTDLAGFLRFQDGYLDLGAYEFGGAINAAEISVSEIPGNELTDGGSISFGTVKKGMSRKKTFLVKNVGNNGLAGISYVLSGSKRMTLSKSYLKRLDPGASVKFTVTFKPTAKGKQFATLKINSNDANESPFDINFSGTGKVIPGKKKAKSAIFAAAVSASMPENFSNISNAAVPSITTKTFEDGLQYLVLSVAKPPGSTNSDATVEVSSDLLEWSSGSTHTTTLVNSPAVLTVRDNTPITQGEKRYIRLK